jgi:TolA-binding protein
MKRFGLVCAVVVLSGCLKTRADLRGDGEDPTPQKQTAVQQRAEKAAPAKPPPPVTAAARFEEYDEQMRQLNGRVDVLENSVSQVAAGKQGEAAVQAKEKQALDQRLLAYEEAIKKLEAQVQALSDEVTRLKTPPPAPEAAPAASKGRAAYDEGEELFNKKKWKEAIVSYQKYRDNNPKGKMYADCTYKIGMAFHELGMKDESKAFFEEVVSKFPGSKEAKKAQLRMKSGK